MKERLFGILPYTLLMKVRLAVLAVLSVLLMTIFAGCIGADYVANRDIVVIRLHPDGTTAWIRSIDTGYDDSARDMVETPDGGLLIAGGKTTERIGSPSPRMVRLSPEGTVLWDRVPGHDSHELTAVALTAGGDYVAAAYDGRVLLFDPDGNVRWERETGLEGVWSVIATQEGGFVVGGETMARIPFGTVVVYNPDDTVSSRPPFPNESVMTPGVQRDVAPPRSGQDGHGHTVHGPLRDRPAGNGRET